VSGGRAFVARRTPVESITTDRRPTALDKEPHVEPFIGQIELFPFNFAPQGWALCEGQLLPISQNTPLFSLLGTTYGGDGSTNFALPSLKGKGVDPNLHYCIALQGVYPSRP